MADVIVNRASDGMPITVDSSEIPALIANGTIIDPGQNYGQGGSSGPGGAIHRFLESIASETSFGASDVLRREGGLAGSGIAAGILPAAAPMYIADLLQGPEGYSGEAIDQAQQLRAAEHPVADKVGRIVGGLGQAFATGGATGPGRVISALSPVGLADEAGRLVTRAIGRSMTSRPARVAAALGRWGVEGGVSGVEGAVIDSLANDTPLTAEALLHSGLIGIGAGMGLGGLGFAASRGIRAIRANQVANGSFGQGPVDRLLGRAQTILGGVDDEHIRVGQDPELRRRATLPEPELEDLASFHANTLDTISTARDRIRNSIEMGAEGYRPHLEQVNPITAQARALEFLNGGIEQIRRALTETPPLDTRGLRGLENALMHRANRIVGAFDPLDPSLLRPGATESAFDVYRELDALRETLGNALKGKGLDPLEARIYNDVYHNLQGAVEQVGDQRVWRPGLLSDTRIWGQAGDIQARNAQATAELIQFETALSGRMQERFTRAGEPAGKLFTTGKLRGALDYMGTGRGENLHAALLEWLDRQERLAELYARDLGAGEVGEELAGQIRAYRPKLQDALNTFTARNTFNQGQVAEQTTRGFGAAAGLGGTAVVGGLLGYSITGDPLAAIAGAGTFAALTRPMLYYRFLASKDRMLSRFNQRFSGAMGRFRNRMKGLAGGRARSRGFISPLVAPITFATSRNARNEEIDNRIGELRQLQANPQTLVENVGDSLSDVSVFQPELAGWMQDAVMRGIQYMWAHLPPLDSNPLAPHLPSRPRSDTERDNFMHMYRTVMDPLSAVEDLADLRLHPIAAQTLRDVHPEIFMLTQQEIIHELGELRQDPPYQVKINLGTLLQYPTDASLDPEFIALMQSRAAQTTQQAQTVGLSRQGAQSGMAERTMTETTSLMNPEQ